MTLDYRIKELSEIIKSIEELRTPKSRVDFYSYKEKNILDYLKEALEHLILKRDIKNIAEINKDKLIENYDKAKEYDYSYKNTECFFKFGEEGLTERLLKYAPNELVEMFKMHFNNHLRFRELYALKKAVDSLEKKYKRAILFGDYSDEGYI